MKATKISRTIDLRNRGKSHVVRWWGQELNPRTGHPRCYSKSFCTKSEAKNFESKLREKFKKGGRRDEAKETIDELCNRFLAVNGKKYRPATRQLYQYSIDHLLSYFGRDYLARKLTTSQADVFIAQLNDKQLSDWTIHRILRNLKTIFKKAVRWNMIITNPFTGIVQPEPEPSDFHYLTPQEYVHLLKNTPDLRRRCLYALCATGGCRLSEALSRQWADFDFATGDLEIAGRKGTATEPEFVLKNRKGKRLSRTVRLPLSTVALLRELRRQNIGSTYILLSPDQHKKMKTKWQSCQETGRPWRWAEVLNNINRDLLRHIAKAGIEIKEDEKFSLHTLRKSAAKTWATVNRDQTITQKLMGHTSIVTTSKYYDKITPEDRARAARATEALLHIA